MFSARFEFCRVESGLSCQELVSRTRKRRSHPVLLVVKVGNLWVVGVGLG